MVDTQVSHTKAEAEASLVLADCSSAILAQPEYISTRAGLSSWFAPIIERASK